MKVVLFCGGQGLRMRSLGNNIPKPLMCIGGTALIDCLMHYYAHHGHKEFIICLGHGASAIVDHFRRAGAQFLPTISSGTPAIRLRLDGDPGYDVTLVDTGVETSIGQRLLKVERYLEGETMFLANYSDGLTDLHLPAMIETVASRPSLVGAMVAVKPIQSFHYVHFDGDGMVTGIAASPDTSLRINGGYFVFRPEIFRYLDGGDDLVDAPFARLASEGRLLAHPHDGFWRACDTLKDVQTLEAAWAAGNAPWEVWRAAGLRQATA